MTPRVSAQLWVSALIRRVNAAGGFATVLTKGDESAGGVILVFAGRDQALRVFQRVNLMDGGFGWQQAHDAGAGAAPDVEDYLSRQRRYDSDLWVVELDIPHPERFIGEPILNR